jgi:hypothetical protein
MRQREAYCSTIQPLSRRGATERCSLPRNIEGFRTEGHGSVERGLRYLTRSATRHREGGKGVRPTYAGPAKGLVAGADRHAATGTRARVRATVSGSTLRLIVTSFTMTSISKAMTRLETIR